MAGLDGRYYKGSHFQTVYDLMGGDYAIDKTDANQVNGTYLGDPNLQNAIRKVGDTVSYFNDAFVKWAGAFTQLEFKKNKWTAFFTSSVSQTSYQRVDYYKKKDLIINGETFEQVVGNGDRFFYNGTDYLIAGLSGATSAVAYSGDTTFVGTGASRKYIVGATPYTNQSAEARYATTEIKKYLGATFKTGANFNINENHNAFVNTGFLYLPPRMNLVFDNNNKPIANTRNQEVYAVEGGYSIHHREFAVNLNAYYTIWKNKPPASLPSVPTPDGTLYYNINGLNALHKGLEIDFVYKGIKNLEVEGLVSLGDWTTTSGSKANVTNDDGQIVDEIDFSAKGVHVGDAAQMQFAGSLRYEIIKQLFIKARYTYFDKNFANFDPTLLENANRDRESWRMPAYGLLDIFAGYDFRYWKTQFTFSVGINNVLNTIYLTDAQNGNQFDATTALVYMGMGRRITGSLRISF
jgi:hypothetical protein